MSGKNLNLNSLESRKRLLLAESELNRTQILQEWRRLTNDAHALAHEAGTIRSIVSATASLVAGLRSLRCKKTAPPCGKPSWLQSVLSSAGLLSNLWSAFRPRNRE